jgi:heat shock protein HslJ
MKKISTITIAVAALSLGACDKPVSQDLTTLSGAEYTAIHGELNITLSFAADANMVSGKALNTYRGPFESSATGQIKFGPMMSTMMAGIGTTMQDERAYFEFLATTEKYEIGENTLTLINTSDEEIVFERLDK